MYTAGHSRRPMPQKKRNFGFRPNQHHQYNNTNSSPSSSSSTSPSQSPSPGDQDVVMYIRNAWFEVIDNYYKGSRDGHESHRDFSTQVTYYRDPQNPAQSQTVSNDNIRQYNNNHGYSSNSWDRRLSYNSSYNNGYGRRG